MMDLIDRAAVKAGMMKYGFTAPDMTVHEFVEDELPAIPAVPLEPLCEWLAVNCREKILDSYCKFPAETWKQILTEWMEGQHDTE